MTSLLQELLTIKEAVVLTERVDNMLDRLKTHFSNEHNINPVKAFSREDIELTAYQLAGLRFILDQKDLNKKLPELAEKRILLTFFNELDEPRERKLFNDRTQTADEFLASIGKKNGNSEAKSLLKYFEDLKNLKNITANSTAIVRYVSKLEQDLKQFLKTVK